MNTILHHLPIHFLNSGSQSVRSQDILSSFLLEQPDVCGNTVLVAIAVIKKRFILKLYIQHIQYILIWEMRIWPHLNHGKVHVVVVDPTYKLIFIQGKEHVM